MDLQLMIDGQKKLESLRMETNILEFDLLKKLQRPGMEKMLQLRNQLENEFKLKEKEWRILAEAELEPKKLISQEMKKKKAKEQKESQAEHSSKDPSSKKPVRPKRKSSESSTEEGLRGLISKKMKKLSVVQEEDRPEMQEEVDQELDSSED